MNQIGINKSFESKFLNSEETDWAVYFFLCTSCISHHENKKHFSVSIINTKIIIMFQKKSLMQRLQAKLGWKICIISTHCPTFFCLCQNTEVFCFDNPYVYFFQAFQFLDWAELHNHNCFIPNPLYGQNGSILPEHCEVSIVL